jgi:hypothetical protein
MSLNVAVLDENNKVVNVIVVNEDYELDVNEIVYTDVNPAFIGGDYIEAYFYPPQPFASWIRSQGKWIAPKPYPAEGWYFWDEQLGDWVEALAE